MLVLPFDIMHLIKFFFDNFFFISSDYFQFVTDDFKFFIESFLRFSRKVKILKLLFLISKNSFAITFFYFQLKKSIYSLNYQIKNYYVYSTMEQILFVGMNETEVCKWYKIMIQK